MDIVEAQEEADEFRQRDNTPLSPERVVQTDTPLQAPFESVMEVEQAPDAQTQLGGTESRQDSPLSPIDVQEPSTEPESRPDFIQRQSK